MTRAQNASVEAIKRMTRSHTGKAHKIFNRSGQNIEDQVLFHKTIREILSTRE